MSYARLWATWEATGFSRVACPWKKHREMKKHKPKPWAYEEALKELTPRQ